MSALDRPIASSDQRREIAREYWVRRRWLLLSALLPLHLMVLPKHSNFARQTIYSLGLIVLWSVLVWTLREKSYAVILAIAYMFIIVPVALLTSVSEVARSMMSNQDLKNELYQSRGVFEP